MAQAPPPDRTPPAAPQGERLSRSVRYSGLAQMLPLVTNVVLTPYLIATLGIDAFGVWSLLLVLLATLASLDGGIAASLGRFHAVHAAAGDRRATGQLVTGALLVYLVLGALTSAVCWFVAPPLVGVLQIPAGLESEAVVVLRSLGLLVALALAGASATALLQGTGRFGSLAGLTTTSSVVYVALVVVLVGPTASLPGLVVATALRYGVLLVGGIALGARDLELGRPLLPGRRLRTEFVSYALRMQASGVTSIVGTQLDGLVVAALLPVRYVGIYAAGYQAAAALRAVPLFAFPPVLTRLSGRFRTGGQAAAVEEFGRLEALWAPAALAYGVIATAAIGLGVQIWLGEEFLLSGVVAAVLMAGYGVQVAVTGMRTCLVRAVGQPGLEMRYSVVAMVVNLVLTVPLALAFGLVGVVVATAVSLVVGSLHLVRLCRPLGELRTWTPDAGWLLWTAAGVALTVLGELLLLRTGLRGPGAFVLAGLPAALGLAVAGLPLLRAHRRARPTA